MVVIEVVGGQWRVGLIWEYKMEFKKPEVQFGALLDLPCVTEFQIEDKKHWPAL